MASSPGPNDLTALGDVQAWLSLPPAQDADLLQRLISAASAMMQSYLGYMIAPTTYTDVRSGNGKNILFLAYRPVISVDSLAIGPVMQTPSAGYGQTGYSFDDESVYLTGASFDHGFKNVFITYTAGYAQTPLDLAQACTELVALRYKLRDKTGYVSESAMQGGTTSYSQKDMPASAMTALQPYKRVF